LIVARRGSLRTGAHPARPAVRAPTHSPVAYGDRILYRSALERILSAKELYRLTTGITWDIPRESRYGSFAGLLQSKAIQKEDEGMGAVEI
jgi:hypothetical protein